MADSHYRTTLPLLIVGLGTAANAAALEIVASVQNTSEYTTNSARSANDELKEWIHAPGIDLNVSQDSATLHVDSGYSYSRRFHQQDLYDDENVTTGQGSLVWNVIPNRLDFSASNTRSESTESAIAAENQDNRQVVSNTQFGPTLMLQPRRGDELQLSYTYASEQTDNTNNDSQRHGGTARYLLGLSAQRNLVFDATYSDISYDDDTSDSTSLTGTVGYQQLSGDLTYDINAGYTEFERDEADSVNGGVYSANVTWQVSGATTLAFAASRDITDQSSSFFADDIDGTLPEESDTNDVFTETTADISLTQVWGRTDLALSVYGSQEDYEDVDRDSKRYGTNLSVSRALTRTTTVTASGDLSRREFDDQDDEQDELRARILVSHRIGRSLDFSWGAAYEDRNADTTDSYDELRYTLQLVYTFLGAR